MSNPNGAVLSRQEYEKRRQLWIALKDHVRLSNPIDDMPPALYKHIQDLITSSSSNFRSVFPTHEPPASTTQARPEVSAKAMSVITMKLVLTLVSSDPKQCPSLLKLVPKNVQLLGKAMCEYLEFSVKQLSTHVGTVDGGAAEDEEVDAIFRAPSAFDGALDVACSDRNSADPSTSAADAKNANPHKSLFAAYKNHPRLLCTQALLCLTRNYQITCSSANPTLHSRLMAVAEACIVAHAKLVVSHGSLPPAVQRQVKHFPLDGNSSPVYSGSLVSNAGSSRPPSVRQSNNQQPQPIFTNGVIRAAFHYKLSQNVTFLAVLSVVNAANVWGAVYNVNGDIVDNASALIEHGFGDQFVKWHSIMKGKIMELADTTTNTSGTLRHGRSNLSTADGSSNTYNGNAAKNPLVIRSVDGFVSILTLALGMLRTAQGDQDKGLDYVVDSFRGDRHERNMPEGDFSLVSIGQGASSSGVEGGNGRTGNKLGGGLSSLSGGGSKMMGGDSSSKKSSSNPVLVNAEPIHFQGKVCKRLEQLCPDAVSDLMIPASFIPAIYFDLVQHLTVPDILPALKHLADLDCTSYGHYMSTLEQAIAARDDATRRRQQHQQQQQQYLPSHVLGAINPNGTQGQSGSGQQLNVPLVASLAYPYTCSMRHLCDLLTLVFQHLPASYLRTTHRSQSRVVNYGHSNGGYSSNSHSSNNKSKTHGSAFSNNTALLQHQTTATAILTSDEQHDISEEDNGVAAFIFRNMILHLQVVFQEYKPASNASTVALIGLTAGGGIGGNDHGGGGMSSGGYEGMGKSQATQAMDDLWESYTTKLVASYIELLATVAGLEESVAARVFVAIMGDGQVELPEIQWNAIIRQTTLAMLIPDFTTATNNSSSSNNSSSNGNNNNMNRLGGVNNQYSDPFVFNNGNDSNPNNNKNIVQSVLYNGSNADTRMMLSQMLSPYAYGSLKSNLANQITMPYYLKCHQRLTNATLRLVSAVASSAPRCPLEYKISVGTLINFFDSHHLSPECLSALLNALGSLMCSAEEQLLIWRALRDKGLFRIGARWSAMTASSSGNSSGGGDPSALSNEICTSLPEHCLQECRVGTFDITVGLLKYLLGSIRLIAHPQYQSPLVEESTTSKATPSTPTSTNPTSTFGSRFNHPFDGVMSFDKVSAPQQQPKLITPSEALFRDPAFRAIVKFVSEDIMCSLHRRVFLRGSKEMYEIAALGLNLLNEILVATTDCGSATSKGGNAPPMPHDELTGSVMESLFGGVGLNGGSSDDGCSKSFIHFMFDEDRKSVELARKAASSFGADNRGGMASSSGKNMAESESGEGTSLLPKQSTGAAFSTILATGRAPNDTLNTILKLIMESVAALCGEGGGRPDGETYTINRDAITPYRIVALRVSLQLLVSSMTVMKSNKTLADSAFTFNSRTFDSTDFVIAMLELPLINDPVITRRAMSALTLVDPRVVTRSVQILMTSPNAIKQHSIAHTLSELLRNAYETTIGAQQRHDFAISLMQAGVRGGVLLDDAEIKRQEEALDNEVDMNTDYMLNGVPAQLRNLGKERLFQHCTPSVAHSIVTLLSLNATCTAPSLTSWVCGLEHIPSTSSYNRNNSFVEHDSPAQQFGLGAILEQVNNFYFCTQASSAALAAKYLQLLMTLFANKSVSMRPSFTALVMEPHNVKYLRMVQVLSSSASLLSNPVVGSTLRPKAKTDVSFLSMGANNNNMSGDEGGMFKGARAALLGGGGGISVEDRISTSATITMVYMLEFAGYAMQIAAMRVQGLAEQKVELESNTHLHMGIQQLNGIKNASALARSEDPICEFVRKLLRVPSAAELRQSASAASHSGRGGDAEASAMRNDFIGHVEHDENISDGDEDGEWTTGQAEAFAHIPGSWNSTLHNSLTSMEFGLRLWYTMAALPNFPAIHLPLRGESGSSYMVMNSNNRVPQFSIPAVHQLLIRENSTITLSQLREKLRVYVYANSCLLSYASGCEFAKGWASIMEVASFVTHNHSKELAPANIISACANIASTLPITTHFTVSAQATIVDRLTNALVSLSLRLSQCMESASPATARSLVPAINDLLEHVVGALIRFGSISEEARENLYSALQIILSLPGGIIVNGATLVANADALFAMILSDTADNNPKPRKMHLVALNTLRKLFTSQDLILMFAVAKRQQHGSNGAMTTIVGPDGKSCLADLTLTSRSRLGLRATLLMDAHDIEHGGGSMTPNMVMASPSKDLSKFICSSLQRLSECAIQLNSANTSTINDPTTRLLGKYVLEYSVALGDILRALSATVPHLVYLARGGAVLTEVVHCWTSLAETIAGTTTASTSTLHNTRVLCEYLLLEQQRPNVIDPGYIFLRKFDFTSMADISTQVMISMMSWISVLIRDPSMQSNEGCISEISEFVKANPSLINGCLTAGVVNTQKVGSAPGINYQHLQLAESTSMMLLNLSSAPSQTICKSVTDSFNVIRTAVAYCGNHAIHTAAYVVCDPLYATTEERYQLTSPGAIHLSYLGRINRNIATFLINTVISKTPPNPIETAATAEQEAIKAQEKKKASLTEATILKGKNLFGLGGSKKPIVPTSNFELPESSARTEKQVFPLFTPGYFQSLITLVQQMFLFAVKALAHASSYIADMNQKFIMHSNSTNNSSSDYPRTPSHLYQTSGTAAKLFFSGATDTQVVSSRSVLLGRKSILPALLGDHLTSDQRDFNMKIEQLPHICLQTLGSLVMLLHFTVVEIATHIRFGMANELLLSNQQGAKTGGHKEGDGIRKFECNYQPSYLRTNPHLATLAATITDMNTNLARSVSYQQPIQNHNPHSLGGGVGWVGGKGPASRLGGNNNNNRNGGAASASSSAEEGGNGNKPMTLGDYVNNCTSSSSSHRHSEGDAETSGVRTSTSAAAELSSNKTIISPTTGCAAHDSRSAIIDDNENEEDKQPKDDASGINNSRLPTNSHSNYYLSLSYVEGSASNSRPTPLTHDQYRHLRRVQAMLQNASRDVERLASI